LEQELRSSLPDGNNPFPEGITACPSESDMLHWTATIRGPPESPYELGVFKVQLKYPEDYPFKAPEVQFMTEVYHPNITMMGKICLDILADKWSPSYNIRTVLQQLQGLLAAPNPDDPLVREPAITMKQDVDLFKRMAREMTLKYAVPKTTVDVASREDEAKDASAFTISPRRISRAHTAPPAVDLQTMIETAISVHEATHGIRADEQRPDMAHTVTMDTQVSAT